MSSIHLLAPPMHCLLIRSFLIAVLTVEIGTDVSGNDRMFLAKFQILLILYVLDSLERGMIR